MLSLPDKYRPKVFSDLVGQDHVQKYLSTLIKRGPISRNIIFYGPWGSGKTTSARLYARALNCESPVEGSPDNECDSCRYYLSGEYPEYIEFDGATAGRVENIKSLREVANQPPIHGKYRVIQIEEAQGLSNQAWDVLLKVIEEPPSYLVFLFTTTEIDKVRPAIRSRCQVLDVKTLSSEDSKILLESVSEKEGMVYEDSAIKLISNLSGGHSRDLLKNLEQVSWMGDISYENVCLSFNLRYIQFIPKLMGALVSDNLMDLHVCLSSCPDSPGDTYLQILNYLLYSKYKVHGIHIESMYEGDLQWGDILSGFKGGLEGVLLEILNWSSQFEVKSHTSLEIWAVTVFNYLHDRKYEGSLGKPLRIDSGGNLSLVKRDRRPMKADKLGLDDLVKTMEPKKEDSVSVYSIKELSLGHSIVPSEWNLGGFQNKL